MINKVDAISRNELLEYIEALYLDHYKQAYDQTVHDIFNAVRRRIRRCSKVQQVEVKYAEWLVPDEHYPDTCSNCRFEFVWDGEECYIPKFCPECGAKMMCRRILYK